MTSAKKGKPDIIVHRPKKYQPISKIISFIKKLKQGDVFSMSCIDLHSMQDYIFVGTKKIKGSRSNVVIRYRHKRRFEKGYSKINKVSSHRIIAMRDVILESGFTKEQEESLLWMEEQKKIVADFHRIGNEDRI